MRLSCKDDGLIFFNIPYPTLDNNYTKKIKKIEKCFIYNDETMAYNTGINSRSGNLASTGSQRERGKDKYIKGEVYKMKKKMLRRLLSLTLCASMLFSTAACGGKEQEGDVQSNAQSNVQNDDQGDTQDEGQNEGSDSVVELECFFNAVGATCSTEDVSWLENYMAENLGIVLRGRPNDDSNIVSTLLAGGELPDVIGLNGTTDYQSALDGGMLLDLSQYKEQLPNIFENEQYAGMIAYRTEKLSNGTGGLYAIPAKYGINSGCNILASIRYDLWAKIGFPEPQSWDEMLDMLKEMQEAARAEGEEVYAYSFFNDWDSLDVYGAELAYGAWEGLCHIVPYVICDGKWIIEHPDPETWTDDDIQNGLIAGTYFDDDSLYYQSLKYLFKANQMGLVDPEATAQSMVECGEKMNTGSIMFSPYDFWGTAFNGAHNNEDDFKGYANVMFPFQAATIAADTPIGINTDLVVGISADCKNLDAALKFVNWLYSDEYIDLELNGLEGWTWEYDSNGDRVLTEAYIEARAAGTELEHPDGGTFEDLSAAIPFFTVLQSSFDEEANSYSCLLTQYNATTLPTDKLSQDWQSHYGEYKDLNYKRIYGGEEATSFIKDPGISYFVPATTDEITQITQSISSIMVQNSWKMIFAESEEEFESLWDQTQQDAEALGLEKVIEDGRNRLTEAIDSVIKYCK